MSFTTDVDLAAKLEITVKKLHELRRKNDWPHLAFGRFDIRFTDEQVAQIIAMQTKGGAKKSPTAAKALPGQTARSARRRSA